MKQLKSRLILLVTTMLVLSSLLMSWFSVRHFEQNLPGEMARNVLAIGNSTVQVLEKAYVNGIPFDEMTGVDDFLSSVRKDNPSIAYMFISNSHGKVIYQSGYESLPNKNELLEVIEDGSLDKVKTTTGTHFNTSIPLVFKHYRVATLHLGQPSAIVEQKVKEISYDVIAVLVVASLVAFELTRFVLTFLIVTPMDVTKAFLVRVRGGDFACYLPFDNLPCVGSLSQRLNQIIAEINYRYQALQRLALSSSSEMNAQISLRLKGIRFHATGERNTLFSSALDHIRWPFFLLIFADSMSLSFFPVYVEQFYAASMNLSKNLVIGLPISIFMFTWALSMPWAGAWGDRVGHRKAFIWGSIITSMGLIFTACAQSLYDLMLWRSLTALGYGLVFITVQGYISANTPAKQRTKGMAVFMSSFFAGSLSGSAIGGILADRISYSAIIFLSALLSIAAALFVLRFLRSSQVTQALPKKMLSIRDFKLLLKNKKFLAITFLAAVPAKIALSGFLYYCAPLYLKLLGNNQSTTGRVMMAYGLAIIFFTPLVAKITERLGNLRWFVSIGGYAATAAMFTIYFTGDTKGLLASISLLGIAHAIGVSPQLALINDFCSEVVQEVGSGTATGIFRLIERLGNVSGPIIAGILISQFGFSGAFLGIAIGSFICITSFTLIFFVFDRIQSNPVSTAH